jgi:hypothetical protein
MLLAAVICLLPASALAAGPAPDQFYGVNPGDLFKLPQSQWDTHLQTIADDGVQVVRMGAWWSDLEPAAPVNGVHLYSWSDVDQQVAALARHNLRWEPLLCFSATWGSTIPGDYNGAPDGTQNFALFAAALVKRYGPGGSFWAEHPNLPALPVDAYEVWNEENAKVYWHPSTPEDYADLYAATRSAIHGVDADARVVVGGLAAADTSSVLSPADFLRKMVAHRPDLKGNIDAVALHPYARNPQGVYDKIAAFRHDLDAIAGPGIPLELTEIGWSTTDTAESNRADYLRELASTLPRTDCGLERMTAYAWLGPEQDSSDREQWFGMANRDGSNKPSASAFAASVRMMRGLADGAPTDTIHLCSGADTRSVSATPARKKAARLKLNVKVRRHPRRAGRLIIAARCSSTCQLQVQVGVPRPQGVAWASRATTLAITSRHVARRQTLSVNFAKSLGGAASRLKIKVTAVARSGSRVTRYRTVQLRPAGFVAAQSARSAYVPA